MLKTGYALWDTQLSAVALSFHDVPSDGNGRPLLHFVIPGTTDQVHTPAVGDTYANGRYVFAERWWDDPGPVDQWRSRGAVATTLNAGKVIQTQQYSATRDIIPENVRAFQFRRALRQLNRRADFEAYVTGLTDGEDRDYWLHSETISMTSEPWTNLATALGLTNAQTVALFRLASTL